MNTKNPINLVRIPTSTPLRRERRRIFTVVLTGGIASGKSTLSEAFSRKGIDVIDADLIARRIVAPRQPALAAIVEHFGKTILQKDGQLDRARLRKIMIDSPSQRYWLNTLLHPLIRAEGECQRAAVRSPWCLWVIPLYAEAKEKVAADRVLVVDVDPCIQLARVMTRDHVTKEQANALIEAQAKREHRLALADDVIENNGNPCELLSQVENLYQKYLFLSRINDQE